MTSHTILIIDDKPSKREPLADYVTMLGHKVLEAENGLYGLTKARQHRPDLILLDLSMPEMDGMGFLVERDRDPVLKSIPVIIITARESSEIDVVQCLAKRGGLLDNASFLRNLESTH